jgi:hypothetical protein
MEELKHEEVKIKEIVDKIFFWVENELNQLLVILKKKMLAPGSPMKNGNSGFLLQVPLQMLSFRSLKQKLGLFSPMTLKFS